MIKMVKIEKQRYILFKVIKDDSTYFEEKTFLNSIWQSIWKYFGMKGANKVGLWLLELNLENNLGIIRCTNKTKEEIITALTFIKEIDDKRVIFSPIKTSGTIKGLKK